MHSSILFLLSFQDWLIGIDKELFVLIHSKWASPSFDGFFKTLRNALTWIPLYLFLLFWIVRYHKKYAWQFVLLTLVVFAITDFTSASILKPAFMRLRPCFDPTLYDVVRTVVTCGGKYGMPSSHASNHFGMASFWFFTIASLSGRRWHWLWIWALVICYAQVYVGKHFPGDTLVGALLGTTVGYLTSVLFARWLLRPVLSPARMGE